MDDARKYRVNAERCEAAAAHMTRNDLLRSSYLEIARRWRELAQSVEDFERRMSLPAGVVVAAEPQSFRDEAETRD